MTVDDNLADVGHVGYYNPIGAVSAFSPTDLGPSPARGRTSAKASRETLNGAYHDCVSR